MGDLAQVLNVTNDSIDVCVHYSQHASAIYIVRSTFVIRCASMANNLK